MIFRPFTSLCLVAFLGAGMHVYSTKHEAAVMDRELRSIARKVEEAEARSQTLQAEWAWLNEPERLRAVAQRHLPELEAMQPAQFVRASEAERRLPPVAAYEGPVALFAPREPTMPAGNTALALLSRVAAPVAVVQVAVTAPAAAAPVIAPMVAVPAVPAVDLAALPLPPPEPEAPPVRLALPAPKPVDAPPRPALVDLARAMQPRPAEARPVEAPRLAEPARPAQVELARATVPPRPAPKPVARPTEIAALPPVAAPARALVTAPGTGPGTTPVAAPVTQVAVSAAARVAPVQPAMAPARAAASYPAMGGGSALGLGGQPMLPPPVPFGSASAATLNGAMGR
jgi:hypothetical protein